MLTVKPAVFTIKEELIDCGGALFSYSVQDETTVLHKVPYFTVTHTPVMCIVVFTITAK